VLQLITLGGLSLRREDPASAEVSTQPRRLALLALIGAAGERGVTREKVLGLLWPDVEEERARSILSQALYALKRDLGREDLFLDTPELRLNPAALSCDRGAFLAAVAGGRLEEAVGLYAGPFLDGVYVKGAGEFERWVEDERGTLARKYTDALEQLARAADERRDHAAAVKWWRALATHHPLSARYATGYMQALTAAGDRAGALRHARIHAELVNQELGASADHSIRDLEARLRTSAAPRKAPDTTAAEAPLQEPAAAPSPPPPSPARRRRYAWAGLAATAVALVAWVVLHRAAPHQPVIAVGEIRDYTGARSGQGDSLAPPLADLLATNLARTPGLRVVSGERMLELNATRPGGPLAAARSAGADQVVDGALYRRDDGSLRLDLRRVDLTTGQVRDAFTVQAGDLFTLVDAGTTQLVAQFGLARPEGSVTTVTTHSLAALRLYDQGLANLYRGDGRAAHQLFLAALSEDSTFAMAAYFAGMSAFPDRDLAFRYLDEARRLGPHASDRERLLIELGWGRAKDDPSQLAVAETLTTRYPNEPRAFIGLGDSRTWLLADFPGAVAAFRRAIELDPGGFTATAPRCLACEATSGMAMAYTMADSLETAERVARKWIRENPKAPGAWGLLAATLGYAGRFDEARAADSVVARLDPAHYDGGRVRNWLIPAGRFAEAETVFAGRARDGAFDVRTEALWMLAVLRREQGRPDTALQVIAQLRRLTDAIQPGPHPSYEVGLLQAQALLEAGHPRAAAALFDTVSVTHDTTVSLAARHWTWAQGLRTNALMAAGDTAAVHRLADELRRRGARSGYARDRRLYHHALGLLARARGEPLTAASEFRQAIFSPTIGYTRTNLELGRALLALRQYDEAARVLRAGLRGPVDGPNLYVTRTELHAALGRAFELAGQRDSARAHYRFALAAWNAPEPIYQAARDSVAAGLARLGG
jgi:DNA-binding SARP family transcriptional activator/tetratricopeptide (TPR) repeat protein